MPRIEHLTLTERAYEQLRRGLISGRFAPGQPMRIRKLAEDYGISTTPVREALQRLVAERLLQMQPNRTIVVPSLAREAFAELTRIRCALEGMAGELAAARATPAQVRQLTRILDDIDAAVARRDVAQYLVLNGRFHFGLYQRAESPHLLEMIQSMWSRVGPLLAALFSDAAYLPDANAHHRAILAALAAGDAEGVRAGVVADIGTAAQSLAQRLPSGRDREVRPHASAVVHAGK